MELAHSKPNVIIYCQENMLDSQVRQLLVAATSSVANTIGQQCMQHMIRPVVRMFVRFLACPWTQTFWPAIHSSRASIYIIRGTVILQLHANTQLATKSLAIMFVISRCYQMDDRVNVRTTREYNNQAISARATNAQDTQIQYIEPFGSVYRRITLAQSNRFSIYTIYIETKKPGSPVRSYQNRSEIIFHLLHCSSIRITLRESKKTLQATPSARMDRASACCMPESTPPAGLICCFNPVQSNPIHWPTGEQSFIRR